MKRLLFILLLATATAHGQINNPPSATALGLAPDSIQRSIAKNVVDAFAANVLSNSGTISDAQLLALAASLDPLVSSSAWPKIKELHVPMGDQLAAALVKLKYPAALGFVLTQDNVVSGDYKPSVGLTGGTNKRVKSDFDPSVHIATLNAGFGVFSLSPTWNTGALGGSTVGSSYYLNFQNISKVGTNSTSSHLRGRALQFAQFRGGQAEFGTGGSITHTQAGGASAMSGTFNVFSTAGSFYSDATVGGYAIFEAMTTNELGVLDTFFKQINSQLGRNPYAPDVNFIGDSVTAGVGATSTTNRWVNIFATTFGLAINNQGSSGATLKSPPYPTFSVYALVEKLFNKPSSFYVIALGTNDAYNYDAPSTHLEDFISTYRSMLDQLRASNIDLGSQVIVISPFYPADSALTNGVTRERYVSYVNAVSSLASEYGIPYVDGYATILNAGGPGVAMADGIHPNDVGHAAIAAAVATAFNSRQPLVPQAKR
jgi:lysophospholipase L1-like esterase